MNGDSVQFEGDGWRVLMTPLTGEALLAALADLGAAPQTLNHPDLAKALGRMAAFRIELRNDGGQTLAFNPDQAILRGSGGAGPVGAQVDPAQFWPATGEDDALATLARAFSKSSVSLGPGREHSQLLVFRAFGDKFPRKVRLILGRLYYGFEEREVACQFRTRYSRP